MTTHQRTKQREFSSADFDTVNDGKVLPQHYFTNLIELFNQLAFWLPLPRWTLYQAADLIVGRVPNRQSSDKLEFLGDLNILLSTDGLREKACIHNVQDTKERILDAAQAGDKDRLSPKEWISFASDLGITPGWYQFAIENGLLTDDQTEPAAKVEAVKRGITKQQAINAFEGLHFDRDKWSKRLADPPDWLKECRVTPGVQGRRTSATWNPVLIAAALIDKEIGIKKLDAVFVRLKDWADEWREASASFRD